ncbi:MAG TPA: hypothetical protein VFU38_05550 [Candidatus Krumholzibacteria bacterium]|nr:hypothetical protein [Candidatus Krumholzibacteria bacterium]
MSMGLVAIAILGAGCDDDDPAAPGEPEVTLATFSSGGSASGPTEPPQPYSIILEVGVAHELLPAFQAPDTLYFGNRTMRDNSSFTARASNTTNFDHLATRLTDGVDGTAHVAVTTHTGGGSSTGPESVIFESPAEVTRNGPDLVGHTVTGVRLEVHLDVTDNAGTWTLVYDYIVTILGR